MAIRRKRNPVTPFHATPETRQLAAEVMSLGDYGTIHNTIRVALRRERDRLKQARAATSQVA